MKDQMLFVDKTAIDRFFESLAADQKSANTALEAGFQTHLSKPVDTHQLIVQISILVRTQR